MPTLSFPKSGQPKADILASMRRARDHDAQWQNGRVFGLVYHISDEIDDLLKLGLLEWFDARLRLTPRARLLSNQVFIRFVGD